MSRAIRSTTWHSAGGRTMSGRQRTPAGPSDRRKRPSPGGMAGISAFRKVRVDQLRVGMFIEEICGPWMNHPFWRTSFLLSDAKDLSDMRATGIREVPIDTRKGGWTWPRRQDRASSLQQRPCRRAKACPGASACPLMGRSNAPPGSAISQRRRSGPCLTMSAWGTRWMFMASGRLSRE